MFNIAIVGRANVGKSTLFNKLAHKKHAIVYDLPGTTLDYREEVINFGEISVQIVDTGGYTQGKLKEGSIEQSINKSTLAAISKANLLYFVVDGKVGIQEDDKVLVRTLLKTKTPVVLVINKCDHKNSEANITEFYQLPHDEICTVSAEHSGGFSHLYDITYGYYSNCNHSEFNDPYDLKLAIIGKPNVGKSTLLNTLFKENREIVSENAGTTRDSIAAEINYKGKKIQIIDTAGIRKKHKIQENIEKMSVSQTLNSIRAAEIAVLMLDVNQGLETQDLKIASIIVNAEIKPLIVVVNKIDTVSEKQLKKIVDDIQHTLLKKLANVREIIIVLISALEKKNLDKILDQAIHLRKKMNIDFNNSQLNRWLEHAVQYNAPPLAANGRELKLKFIKQTSSTPLMFKLFSNKPSELPEHYLRYLTRSMQDYFALQSIPLKLTTLKTKNPYDPK